MEILNNIWSTISTENITLINIMSIPLTALELYLTMLLFTTILKINSTKKQQIIYLAITIPLGLICNFIIPKPYSNIITLLSTPIIIMCIFKVNFLKSVFAELFPVAIIIVLEIILNKVFYLIFRFDYADSANIPICRLIINGTIYLLLFILYKIIKFTKLNIKILDNIDRKNKIILFANVLITLVVIFIQIYLIVFYNAELPVFITIITIISLIAYLLISLFCMMKTMNLQIAEQDLEQEKLYNKTLQILHDNIRAFKHDFSNIISGIGGYVETNDIDGLKKYYKQLLQDCNQVSNLGSLNPNSINNPAVYSVLANKYYKADNLGIKITLDSFIDFNNLYMGIYEFTRILGILMDNAIEASSECKNKFIHVEIRNDASRNRQLLIIENTFIDKNINMDKIYEKGYSTKPNNTGLGLWEVEQILRKHKNLSRYTTKNGEFFKQQIEIYKD